MNNNFDNILKDINDFLNKDASSLQEFEEFANSKNNSLIYNIKNDIINYE